METIASRLVERWHSLPPVDIPGHVLTRTALCFEDTIGVALAALGSGHGLAGVRVAQQAGSGSVCVWGAGFSAQLPDAVFANGMLAHAMDFDDLHAPAVMHSSAPIVPTAIGLAQTTGCNPLEMLAAAVVGYEVAARLGRLAPGAFQLNGFQSTGVLGTFATTSVASRLLRLSSEQALNALGIAGSMASGSMEFLADGSEVKQMHPGWSAMAGIRAAQLAKAGMTGPATVFEGRFGVFRSFARTDIDAITQDTTPHEWQVELMGPKPYPACLCVHPQVQAILQLREQGVVGPDRIDHIEQILCEVPQLYVPLVYEPRERKIHVRTAYEARFSAPYCMACALVDGFLDASSFDQAHREDTRVRAVSERVAWQVRELPEFPGSFPARLRVVLRSGETHEAYVRHNLGSPGNPMDEGQLARKFRDCAVPVIGESATAALQQALREMPQAHDIRPLFDALHHANAQEVSWT
jgi:2-methylcitrate dehydratase PrpD